MRNILMCGRRLFAGLAIGVGLAATLFISGCGNQAVDTGISYAAPVQANTQNLAPSQPALEQPLTFDQLSLQSPVVKNTDNMGVTYLCFKYADTNGKIYKCTLPKAMSEGSYDITDWLTTFAVYREPEVVGRKKITKRATSGNVAGFPFIAPKPAQDAATQSDGQMPLPGLPLMPAPTP